MFEIAVNGMQLTSTTEPTPQRLEKIVEQFKGSRGSFVEGLSALLVQVPIKMPITPHTPTQAKASKRTVDTQAAQ